MTKKLVKHKYIGARFDPIEEAKMVEYVASSGDDDIETMSDFFREAAAEYMANHPVKAQKNNSAKPGVA